MYRGPQVRDAQRHLALCAQSLCCASHAVVAKRRTCPSPAFLGMRLPWYNSHFELEVHLNLCLCYWWLWEFLKLVIGQGVHIRRAQRARPRDRLRKLQVGLARLADVAVTCMGETAEWEARRTGWGHNMLTACIAWHSAAQDPTPYA